MAIQQASQGKDLVVGVELPPLHRRTMSGHSAAKVATGHVLVRLKATLGSRNDEAALDVRILDAHYQPKDYVRDPAILLEVAKVNAKLADQIAGNPPRNDSA